LNLQTNKFGFRLDWYSGPTAQVEILLVPSSGGGGAAISDYKLKYTPAIRATLRPPLLNTSLGPQELKRLGQNLDSFGTNLQAEALRQQGVQVVAKKPKTEDGANNPTQDMTDLGWQLSDLVFSQAIKTDLKKGGLFLEIGLNEDLQGYPWELMHDGDNFLCLKHYVGRYVNLKENEAPGQDRQMNSTPEELSILIISVPRPSTREVEREGGGKIAINYEPLSNAEAETNAIIEMLTEIDLKPTIIGPKDANYTNVFRALKSKDYDIIHFVGHGNYNHNDPSRSFLVLQDSDMSAKEFTSFIRNPPILYFVNACETARSDMAGRAWQASYDIFGLVRAFLQHGSYLLGSRWKIGDDASMRFAKEFYKSLLKDEKPLGQAVNAARNACIKECPNDHFSWASYAFYGDPRVGFKREPLQQEVQLE
jgi:CHAT domain-containing protein